MKTEHYANLVIAAVSKAGTTALFSYLAAHPDVCASNFKETKFFMPLKFGEPLPPMSEYAKFFAHYNNEQYLLDGSPMYLWGNKPVANAIKEKLGPVKILFVLRDPVTRCYSWFKFAQYNMWVPKELTFADYIRTTEQMIKDDPARWDNYTRGLLEGYYVNSLPAWYETFAGHEQNLKVMVFEDLKKSPRGFMHELCQWLQIDDTLIPDSVLKPENAGVGYKYGWLRALYTRARKWKGKALVGKALRGTLRKMEQRVNDTAHKEKMSDTDRDYLQQLYAPYNKQLREFLLSKGYTDLPGWVK